MTLQDLLKKHAIADTMSELKWWYDLLAVHEDEDAASAANIATVDEALPEMLKKAEAIWDGLESLKIECDAAIVAKRVAETS